MPTVSIPAPTGGMNAVSNYTNFPITDAVYLYDMIPLKAHVETAPPSYTYYDDASEVMSIFGYEAGTDSEILGAFGSGTSWAIKLITGGTPSTLISGRQNGRYIATMFQSLLIMSNGFNFPLVFNGTTVTNLLASGPSLSDLRGSVTFKGRMYYWEVASQSFWYAAAGAYQGVLTAFPIDTITSFGGKITLLTTFTRDGGEGSDDLFVILMDTGEVLIYQGDDPGSPVAWEMVGKFQMPRPIGPRSALRVGATTLVLTEAGIVDLQQVLAGNPYPLVSAKVEPWLRFTLNPLTQEERDQITMVDIPETASIAVIHLDLCDGAQLGFISGPLCMTKDGGGWYVHPMNLSASAQAVGVNCVTVWGGKTYFGRGISGVVYGMLTEELTLSSADEVITDAWVPQSGFAFAFAPTILSKAQKTVGFPLTDTAIGAFVQPFGGLKGALCAVQTVKGTITAQWDGGKDKVKWYKSTLRVKAGGKI